MLDENSTKHFLLLTRELKCCHALGLQLVYMDLVVRYTTLTIKAGLSLIAVQYGHASGNFHYISPPQEWPRVTQVGQSSAGEPPLASRNSTAPSTERDLP